RRVDDERRARPRGNATGADSALEGPTGGRVVLDVTDATFAADVLESDVPVLFEFPAPWCRPCKAIEPLLLEIGSEHGERLRLAQLDIDVNLGVPARYSVLSLATA